MSRNRRPEPSDRVYIDLNASAPGGASLDRRGSRADIERLGIKLTEGLPLRLWCDDGDAAGAFDPILVEGVAHFWEEKGSWTAVLDMTTFRHASDEK